MLVLSDIFSRSCFFWFCGSIFQTENNALISANLLLANKKINQGIELFLYFLYFLITVFLTSVQAVSESRLLVKYIRLVGTLVLCKITCSFLPWGFYIKAVISTPLFLQWMVIKAWIFPCLIREETHVPSPGT